MYTYVHVHVHVGMHLCSVGKVSLVLIYVYVVCFGHKPISGLMIAAKRKMLTVTGRLSSIAIVLKADVILGSGGRLYFIAYITYRCIKLGYHKSL